MKLNRRYYIYLGIIVVLVGGIICINYLSSNTYDSINNDIAFVDEEITTNVIDDNYFYVDVKGEVKKPGVYKVHDGMIVNDVITLAGGLTKNAYTNNLNLASKVVEGSVIYVYKKSEVTTTKTTVLTSSYKYTIPGNTEPIINNGLININTASKEELLTITGIGESKADQIIEYRKNNPFKTIEDIMNVSGIGESLFAKIKEYITV